MLTIIGPGSRLAKSLGITAPGREYSLRPGQTGLPPTLDGTILVFADPPSIEDTRAAMLDLVSRVQLGAQAHVILISSISATNAQSALFPFEGPYARRKRLAEDIVRSRPDIASTAIRVGNVREYGGWHEIFTGSRLALLPAEARHAAVADLDALRRHILDARPDGPGTLDAYTAVPVEDCFRKVVFVPGLLSLYRSKLPRIAIKVAAKLLRRAGIYLPSPDDLNAFLVKGA